MTAQPALFEAVVTPHRSLSQRGIFILLGCLGAASLSVTLLFWYLGAWPIAGFNGVEMTVAAALLRQHARSRRVREVLRLTADHVHIDRFDINGTHTQASLPAAWLNVHLEEKPGRVPGLFLTTHGHREEVARVLGETQKRDLAEALGAALHRLRNPVFLNPQL
jgi:uncharacterized membrane protein